VIKATAPSYVRIALKVDLLFAGLAVSAIRMRAAWPAMPTRPGTAAAGRPGRAHSGHGSSHWGTRRNALASLTAVSRNHAVPALGPLRQGRDAHACPSTPCV